MAYEAEVNQAVWGKLGERPTKPGKSGSNPFLLWQKDHWPICKQRCDDAHRKATNNADGRAPRNEVRAALGQMWREATEEQKRPYLAQTASNKQTNSASASAFKKQVERWDAAAAELRKEYVERQPSTPRPEELELEAAVVGQEERGPARASKRLNGDVGNGSGETR